MQVCKDIMGLGSWEFFRGLFSRCHVQLLISFSGIGLLSKENCAPSTFLGSWVLMAHICVLSFVFLIDPFWRSMFLRLRGAHTCFNHVYVQLEMTFLLHLRRCTFLLRVWQLSTSQVYKHFLWTSTMTHPLSLS